MSLGLSGHELEAKDKSLWIKYKTSESLLHVIHMRPNNEIQWYIVTVIAYLSQRNQREQHGNMHLDQQQQPTPKEYHQVYESWDIKFNKL